MSLGLLTFYALAAFTAGASIGAVTTRNVVHAVLFLLMSLLGVAAIFVLLAAEFLALVQVLIYGGGITVVLLFAVMLTRVGEYRNMRDNPQRGLALVAAIMVFGIIAAVMVSAGSGHTEILPTSFTTLGTELFTIWAIPFEIASLVLLVALIGAIIIAQKRDGE